MKPVPFFWPLVALFLTCNNNLVPKIAFLRSTKVFHTQIWQLSSNRLKQNRHSQRGQLTKVNKMLDYHKQETAITTSTIKLKDELQSFPLDKIELILNFPQKQFSTRRWFEERIMSVDEIGHRTDLIWKKVSNCWLRSLVKLNNNNKLSWL